MSTKQNPLIDHQGNARYKTVGLNRSIFTDLYHHLLIKSWYKVILIIMGLFLTVNILFTFLYVQCDGINNATHFYDYFFFSIQTLSTIGYGFMYPTNFCSHVLVSAQSFLGLLFVSFLTGIVFAKFSIPRAMVMFTKNVIVSSEDGDYFFKFRMCNTRANQILDASIKVVVIKAELKSNGSTFRRIHDMKLLRSQIPMFSLSFTVQHKIDEESPFYGETHESLVRKKALIVVTISGIDDTMSQTLATRYVYDFNDIVWGSDFKDVLLQDENGTPYFDYRNFHALTEQV